MFIHSEIKIRGRSQEFFRRYAQFFKCRLINLAFFCIISLARLCCKRQAVKVTLHWCDLLLWAERPIHVGGSSPGKCWKFGPAIMPFAPDFGTLSEYFLLTISSNFKASSDFYHVLYFLSLNHCLLRPRHKCSYCYIWNCS